MSDTHRVLIVEDHSPNAEDLAEILRSLSCDPVIVDNKASALTKLKETEFCVVLLDLEIKGDTSSIKGHAEHGSSFLRELRALSPDLRAADGVHLPVLVVSAHANDVDFAVNIMKQGANDVIRKPFESADVSKRVREALERSGRGSHATCRSPGTTTGDGLVLAIPGERKKRRTRVEIGPKTTMLTDSDLKVLLALVAAKLTGKQVHKVDLGGTEDRGFKGISNLTRALEAALPEGVDIIANDYNGNYWLIERVQVGACGITKLLAIGDTTISELAKKIGEHRPEKV